MLSFATDFADQAVVLPLFLCVTLVLWLIGRRHDALVWLATVAATLGVMLVLKVATYDCAWAAQGLGAAHPSGHTASAAVVLGGILVLLLRHRIASIVAAALLASAIGATRLALHVHTPGDVLVGAVVGTMGAIVLAMSLDRTAPTPTAPRRVTLVVACIVVVLVFHGRRLAAEESISGLAAGIWPFSRCLAR